MLLPLQYDGNCPLGFFKNTEFTTEISQEIEKYIFEKNLHFIRIISMCKQFAKESPSQVTSTEKGHAHPQFYLKLATNQNILL